MFAVFKDQLDKMKEVMSREERQKVEEDFDTDTTILKAFRTILDIAYGLKAKMDAGRDEYEIFWLPRGSQRDPEKSREFSNHDILKTESKYGPLGQQVYFCYFPGLIKTRSDGDDLRTPQVMYKARIWQERRLRFPSLVDFNLIGEDVSEADDYGSNDGA